MKAIVEDGCIGCGLCANTCPEVFEMGDDGLAHVIVDEVPEELLDESEEARDGCPVSVITIEE